MIRKLDDASVVQFSQAPEVFPGVQSGLLQGNKPCIVVGGLVAVVLDDGLTQELSAFYREVWGPQVSDRLVSEAVVGRYNAWLDPLTAVAVSPQTTTRGFVAAIALAASIPPPPPGRTNLTPAGPHAPSGPPAVYGHLPFETTTMAGEVFYRCEAWPTSMRLLGSTIAKDTYASPESELDFLPTGFAAVARAALPSFFPACFRYKLTPQPKPPDTTVDVFCGAVVPMYGQSGGGVEVMFKRDAQNSVPFGTAGVRTVIPPL